MANNTISICIPAYHAASFLPETLASVKAQTFREWELIVVEDGSDDGVRSIVETFAKNVIQSVRYMRHEQNKGLPAARNTAMSASRGEFIALLDSDDLWTVDHLETCLKALEKTGADLACSASELFEDQTGRIDEIRTPNAAEISSMPLSLYRRNFMQPSAVVFRRAAFARIGGFDESLRSCEDLDYWFQLLRGGCYFTFTGQPSCRYRKHAATMTRNAFRMAASLAQVRKKHLDWNVIPRRLRLRETANAFGSAGRIIRRSDPRNAAQMFRQALRYEPWRPTWWIGWCLSGCTPSASQKGET
jgi:glycosyltransferase involved in cell wall biosynthesis